MKLESIKANLEKRSLQAEVRPAATETLIKAAEERIGKPLPNQVRLFYSFMNGLRVETPPLEILRIEELAPLDQSLVHFATADGTHRICFDCSRTNDADQWDIVSAEHRGVITMTLASFWSNKIWKWLDQGREFWTEDL
jgi:cell wall assembly regulator SMI1